MGGLRPPNGNVAGAVDVPAADKRYSFKEDRDFHDNKLGMIGHIVGKANFKNLANGQFCKMGWMSRLKRRVEGNAADARYHRTLYESTQIITGSILGESYRAKQTLSPDQLKEFKDVTIGSNERVRNAFYRHDHLRFNRIFADKYKDKLDLSWRNIWAVKMASAGKVMNGVTEFGAAPTGMLLKWTKLLTQLKHDDKLMRTNVRAVLGLGLVAIGVGALGAGLYSAAAASSVIGFAVARILGSYSAVTAVAALTSLGCIGVSTMLTEKVDLNQAAVDSINDKKLKHTSRILSLLREVEHKPQARSMLSSALNKKISPEYRDSDGNSKLLNNLLKAVNGKSDVDALPELENALGHYLTVQDLDAPPSSSGPVLIDPETGKAEILTRSKHFLALTNLIEHVKIHADPQKRLLDTRTFLDSKVTQLNGALVKGAKEQGKKNTVWGNFCKRIHMSMDEARLKSELDPNNINKNHTSMAAILASPHEYGFFTVKLARTAEGLRVFNFAVILSLNYLLTRPIAAATSYLTEKISDEHACRTGSFSTGRFFSSSIWALLDAMFILPLAAGQDILFGAQAGSPTTPFPIVMNAVTTNYIAISVISTGWQMIAVGIPSLMVMGLAKGMCHLEGWHGTSTAPVRALGGKKQVKVWA